MSKRRGTARNSCETKKCITRTLPFTHGAPYRVSCGDSLIRRSIIFFLLLLISQTTIHRVSIYTYMLYWAAARSACIHSRISTMHRGDVRSPRSAIGRIDIPAAYAYVKPNAKVHCSRKLEMYLNRWIGIQDSKYTTLSLESYLGASRRLIRKGTENKLSSGSHLSLGVFSSHSIICQTSASRCRPPKSRRSDNQKTRIKFLSFVLLFCFGLCEKKIASNRWIEFLSWDRCVSRFRPHSLGYKATLSRFISTVTGWYLSPVSLKRLGLGLDGCELVKLWPR